MVPLTSLWVPILVSAAIVFVASSTLRSTIDGLIYGLLTGFIFGWLWPK